MTRTRTATRPWYAGGLRFECQRCRACCTGAPGVVMVTDEEIARLAAHVDLPREAFTRRYLRRARGGWSLVERGGSAPGAGGGDCILLGPEGCTAYEVRPMQCRVFPFWHELLESRETWDEAGRECPGVNTGRLYSLDEIERLRELDS